jgi:hypothetical protein
LVDGHSSTSLARFQSQRASYALRLKIDIIQEEAKPTQAPSRCWS